MKTSIDHLHTELLLEILLWLPGKSLHRCKAVQKSWNCIINTILKKRALVTEHYKKSCVRPSVIVRIPNSGEFGSPKCRKRIETGFVAISNSNTEVVFLDYSFRHLAPDSFMDSFMGTRQVSRSLYTPHCNGIICLHHFSKNSVAVINPGLGRHRILDEHSSVGKNRLKHFHYVGFGFDKIRKAYKVVRVAFIHGLANFAEIWTLGEGKKEQTDGWRMIKVQADHKSTGYYPYTDHQVFCNGVYYWLSHRPHGNQILSFDFCSETFKTIELPPFVESSPPARRYTLLVWRNERVVLFRYSKATHWWFRKIDSEKYPGSIELWVLKEDGTSWNEFLIIPPLYDLYHPLMFWNGDELVLKSYRRTSNGGADHFATYNIVTKSFKKGTSNIDRELRSITLQSFEMYASKYVQSLIWV